MTLGILVRQFGMFVTERHDPPAVMDDPPPTFSSHLAGLHHDYTHHIIPLSLLSRADGDFAEIEQTVIVEHCLALSKAAGRAASDAERMALAKYVGCFRPSLLQLDPALHRLEQESHENLMALLAAALAVIEADGVTKPEEARFLANLKQEFASAGG